MAKSPSPFMSSPIWNTVRILWVALFVSTLSFFAMIFIVKPQSTDIPQQVMLLALGMTALMEIVVSVALPRFLLAKNVKGLVDRGGLKMREAQAQEQGLPWGGDMQPGRVLVDDEQNAKRLIAIVQTSTILGLAIAESIALYGLVLHFLGFAFVMAAPFFVVTWVLFVVMFPRPSAFMAQVEKAAGVPFERKDNGSGELFGGS